MVEIEEDFRLRFEKALQIRDKKPIDVVNATGISESAISQYRSGLTKPKRDRLVLIANYLKVNPSWLMGLDVPMEVQKPIGTISNTEWVILEKYRQLNEDSQKYFVEILDRELEHTHLKAYLDALKTK